MAATYTEVRLVDMETFLRRAFGNLRPKQSVGDNGEIAIDLRLDDHVGVRVWTTVKRNQETSVGVGEDAIRIQYYNFSRPGPMTAGKAPIVKRTPNWRTNLKERIEDVIVLYYEQDEVRDRQVAMLKALLDSGRLSPSERSAFDGMLKTLETGQFMALTDKQRNWVEGRAKALLDS